MHNILCHRPFRPSGIRALQNNQVGNPFFLDLLARHPAQLIPQKYIHFIFIIIFPQADNPFVAPQWNYHKPKRGKIQANPNRPKSTKQPKPPRI